MTPDIFYAIPSADAEACSRCFDAWHRHGCRTAALVDGDAPEPRNADYVLRVERYPGTSMALNLLCRSGPVATAQIIVSGGDDTLPASDRTAQDLAGELLEHFPDGMGLMIPAGDTFGGDRSHEQVNDSPWMGRAFVDRFNGGAGPLWPGYCHWYADTEQALVADRLGLHWRRPDVTQVHQHWTRTGGVRPTYMAAKAYQWAADHMLFEQRRASGFPGAQPLPAPSTGD